MTRKEKNKPLSAAAIQTDDKASSAGRSSWIGDWLFAAMLLVAVPLVYLPAWHGGLVWDDTQHITGPELQSWQGLYRIWFDATATGHYQPVVHTAFWIEHKLWGDNTLGYHLVNIFLHAVAALMAARILRRLEVPGAYLAAAIFALHPVQVETVAWITELGSTLSAVFYFAAALVYLRFDRTRKAAWHLAALGLFLLAIGTNTVTATLPGALLVVFWWQRGRLSWTKDVLPLSPFFVLGAGMGMLTVCWELKFNKCIGPEFDLTWGQRLLIAGRAVWFQLGNLLWPDKLTFIYPRWQVSTGVWWQWLFPLGAAAVLAALWSIRRRSRGPLAAALYFGGTLLPVLGFFNLHAFRYSFVADHYQYLACLGIIALLSAGVVLLIRQAQDSGWVIGALVYPSLLLLLAFFSWRQSRTYADVETLYRATIERNPECWIACNNLGLALFRRGEADEAVTFCRMAVKNKPDFAEAHGNLGMALTAKRQTDDAIAEFREALRLKPDYVEAHSILAVLLAQGWRIDEAIAHYEAALEIKPEFAEVHCNLSAALARRGRFDEAVAHAERAVALNPKLEGAIDNLKNARAGRQKLRAALVRRRELLLGHPDDVTLLNNTARLLATDPNASIRNGAEAVALAEHAVSVSHGDDPEILGTAAAAYAEAGRFDEAAKTADKAVKLAARQDKTFLAASLQAELELYRERLPCRASQSTAGKEEGSSNSVD